MAESTVSSINFTLRYKARYCGWEDCEICSLLVSRGEDLWPEQGDVNFSRTESYGVFIAC